MPSSARTQIPSSPQPGASREESAPLAREIDDWVERARPDRLIRGLDRALDPDGVPRDWPVPSWWVVLGALAAARCQRPEAWPDALDARIEGLFRAALRFSRPGGRALFDPQEDPSARASLLRSWASWLPDSTLQAVVDRWFPVGRGAPAPGIPPLPAFACDDRPLAILRPDWTAHGDLMAVDHRQAGVTSLFDLTGAGQPWLGPTWDHPDPSDATRARPTHWLTGPYADLCEWTFGRPGQRVTRTALLLRGRRLALIAEQVEGKHPAAFRLATSPGVRCRTVADSQAVILEASRGPSARVLPLGLSALARPDQDAALRVEEGALTLRQPISGRRGWMPLLVSWDPVRNRRVTRWRHLTVSEQSRVCPPEVAVAYRVAWGAEDTLVIYRSLGRSASRCFLGHQTSAKTRFLVGIFTPEGEVKPLVKVEG